MRLIILPEGNKVVRLNGIESAKHAAFIAIRPQTSLHTTFSYVLEGLTLWCTKTVKTPGSPPTYHEDEQTFSVADVITSD